MSKFIQPLTSLLVCKTKYLFLSISFLLLTLSLNHPTEALTMKAYSLLELQTNANLIIKGYIETISYKRQQGRLVTVYQWKPSKIYKKGIQILGNSIYMALPGGVEGTLEQVIPGIPRLNQETEYLAFLKCKNQVCSPIGYGQGLWQADKLQRKQALESKQETVLNPSSSLWYSLIEHVRWFGAAPQYKKLTLEQLVGASLTTDESQHHLPPNVAQP